MIIYNFMKQMVQVKHEDKKEKKELISYQNKSRSTLMMPERCAKCYQ